MLTENNQKLKKILFVHHTTAVGGATNSMLYNIQQLPGTGYEAEVLFLDKRGPASDIFEKQGIKITHLEGITHYQHANGACIKWAQRNPLQPITQYFKMLASVPKLQRYLKGKQFDIIHINTSVMLSMGIAAKKSGYIVVWHVREQLSNGLTGIRKRLVRNIINRNSDKIISISRENAQHLAVPGKTEVVYNFVDFNKFNKDLDKSLLYAELQLLPQTVFVTMLGGIGHSKGADIFIKALPAVLSKNPDAVFVIAGYAPADFKRSNKGNPVIKFIKSLLGRKSVIAECLRLIHENGLTEKVKFIGLRQDIPQVLASSAILVWPAPVAHFARPIIEAQAMGIPAVASNFKSTTEVVENGKTGLVFQPLNPTDLADKINQLLRDKQLYDLISSEGYKQAKQLFNAQINFKKILAVYNSL